MKYISKRVEIEATRFVLTDVGEPGGTFMGWPVRRELGAVACHIDIPTRSGVQRAMEGDYIITEMDGDGWYPCSADIFERKYEPIT